MTRNDFKKIIILPLPFKMGMSYKFYNIMSNINSGKLNQKHE